MTDQEQLDHTPINIGKFGPKRQGGALTPSQIAEIDPSWLVWLYEARGPGYKPCSDALYKACLQDLADDAHSPLGDPEYDAP